MSRKAFQIPAIGTAWSARGMSPEKLPSMLDIEPGKEMDSFCPKPVPRNRPEIRGRRESSWRSEPIGWTGVDCG